MQNKENEVSGKERFLEIVTILKNNNVLSGMDPVKFRKILEELGPTFIKIGQILSNRPDMLSDEYIKELSKLRSEVMPMSYSEVLEIIDEEYDCKIHEVFLKIDMRCVGSASIAQVHKAILKNGECVVIKVQRRNIKEKMKTDISLLKKAFKVLRVQQFFKNIVSFDEVLNELLETAYEEMNFLTEASHMEEFRSINKDVQYIKIPKVYKEYSTEKVLVMEYINGINIDDSSKLLEAGYELEEIGSKLADNYIYQAIDCGFFHADPHPDNIFIDDGKIVYLDFGMMGRVTSRDKEVLKNCIIAILENDIREVEKNLLILGNSTGEVNHQKLRKDIERILDKNKNAELKDINITLFANEMLNMLGDNNISLPKDITMLVRGIVVLEGTLETICPSISLIQVLKSRFANRLDEIINKKTIKKEVFNTISAVSSLNKIPNELHVLLEEANSGDLKLNFELTDTHKHVDRLEKMVHRIVVCILDVAFIVGAALIAANDVVTNEQSFLFYLYIILATVFTIWLFVKMYLDKLNRKK